MTLSEFVAQPSVEELNGSVAPTHFGVVVDLGVQVLLQPHSDVGPHQRIVPLGRVSLEIEGAAPLAQAGVQAPAAIGRGLLVFRCPALPPEQTVSGGLWAAPDLDPRQP